MGEPANVVQTKNSQMRRWRIQCRTDVIFLQDQQLCLLFQLQVLSAVSAVLAGILYLRGLHISAVLYQVLGGMTHRYIQLDLFIWVATIQSNRQHKLNHYYSHIVTSNHQLRWLSLSRPFVDWCSATGLSLSPLHVHWTVCCRPSQLHYHFSLSDKRFISVQAFTDLTFAVYYVKCPCSVFVAVSL